MGAKRYMFNKDYVATHVFSTSDNPNVPLKVCKRQFRKGDVIWGELKHKNNVPAFIAVLGTPGVLVIPLEVASEVVTKDITESNADGEKKEKEIKSFSKSDNPKVQYLDAIVIGGILGAGLGYLAEQKQWLPQINKKILYGSITVAALALYLVYRHRNSQKKSTE